MGPRQYGRREFDRRAIKPGGRAVAADGHGGKTAEFRGVIAFGSPFTTSWRTLLFDRIVTGILEGELPEGSLALLGARRTDRGGQAIGCWNWSAAAIARRTLPAHRPGRLPGAFVACATGNLVLEGASRLDAFSAYPVPTWLPGDAPSGTAGTPEVGPPQSSRTKEGTALTSCAHDR